MLGPKPVLPGCARHRDRAHPAKAWAAARLCNAAVAFVAAKPTVSAPIKGVDHPPPPIALGRLAAL